ncbi:hypothetical protein [Serinibacter salmoneus]|nr:hypothetical protein [Serinibacter salmoneus]
MAKNPNHVRIEELESRGWTRELARYYLPRAGGGWYDLAAALEVEKTPQWQEDKAYTGAGNSFTFMKSDLKERGWSPAMIRDLLGDPDLVVDHNQAGTRVAHLFRAVRVEAAEATPEFKERIAKAGARAKRGKAAAEDRSQEVHAAVQERAARLRVDPPSDLATLRELALAHQEDLYLVRGEFGRDVAGADAETVDRWCGNYLRHVCSNYDALLAEVSSAFRGVPGVNDVYANVVRPRVDELVESAMRELRATHSQ